MMKTHRAAAWAAIGLLVVAAAACDSNKPAAKAEGSKPGSTAQPAAGTKHDPPVEKDKVPGGHWYCDMGTVHYSQPDKGNGTCPLCKMKLVQKK